MIGFLTGIILAICLAGGAFYGYCYLSARAQKIPVTDFIMSMLLSIFKKQ